VSVEREISFPLTEDDTHDATHSLVRDLYVESFGYDESAIPFWNASARRFVFPA
jgi:hypothetical protein